VCITLRARLGLGLRAFFCFVRTLLVLYACGCECECLFLRSKPVSGGVALPPAVWFMLLVVATIDTSAGLDFVSPPPQGLW
jgi:hypothetical protein